MSRVPMPSFLRRTTARAGLTAAVTVVAAGAALMGAAPAQAATLGAQQIAHQLIPNAGQYAAFNAIIQHESGWRTRAVNASGAYGLGQALPASKMASFGPNWKSNPRTQIKWALNYMDTRYGSPEAAWSFWQAHQWY
ncbi:transglycosylase SLT domain-containing protein [Streptomyces sp. NBC_01264]|uniref:aggregation-promoting factor C-terminal-like domain-containing protein n=1 Tax=Streptomyces sp. NBC_01264 TaxID=2903804 RepID=UPI00225B970C|nr:transglycosylase SLT domain-containing protein [Streptomyces sp. NBC_01264]MCX4781789.1 transglycosylase SLT domain-containing protein [Streptomyces sp. NBC_01264]